MKKTKAKTQSQSFACSNPECGRAFANPIIVQDLSSKGESSYCACPYCLTEVPTEKNSEVKKKKQTKNEEEKVQPVKKLAQQPSLKEQKCPYHFGYLSERSRKEEIPDECMICEEIVQCMLKKVTG